MNGLPPPILNVKKPSGLTRLLMGLLAPAAFAGAVLASTLILTAYWLTMFLFGWYPLSEFSLEELRRTFVEFLVICTLIAAGSMVLKTARDALKKRKRRKRANQKMK